MVQPLEEQGPVGQTGQCVVEGLVGELLLQRVLLAQGVLGQAGPGLGLGGLGFGEPGQERDAHDQQHGQSGHDARDGHGV